MVCLEGVCWKSVHKLMVKINVLKIIFAMTLFPILVAYKF